MEHKTLPEIGAEERLAGLGTTAASTITTALSCSALSAILGDGVGDALGVEGAVHIIHVY